MRSLRSFFEIIKPFCFLATVFLVFAKISCYYKFISTKAAIEQLRIDAVEVSLSEDVVGQVTQMNQTIASNQSLRQTLLGKIVLPNGWDSVTILDIPKQ